MKSYRDIVTGIKKCIKEAVAHENNELALQLLQMCGSVLYHTNQQYADDELENYLKLISKKEFGDAEDTIKVNKNRVLFFDGFGLNSRGLAQIYLKALCKYKEVIYVVDENRSDSLPDVKRIIEDNNSQIVFLNENENLLEKSRQLKGVIDKYKPEHLMLYTTPSDVMAMIVFIHYCGTVKRYLINLTDHAFWLGKSAFDLCIEFRDYGASISHQCRGIEKEKIVKLPFYPIIDTECEFLGYPFPYDEENQIIIFSGGSVYKTISKDNLYYRMVEHLVKSYEKIIFWYAGDKCCKKMKALIKKYPNRIFFTSERPDLYQVLRHSMLYLNTYPLGGGLMMQYAVNAGTVPLSLIYDDSMRGILQEGTGLQIFFDNVEDLYRETDHLITDKQYYHQQSEKLRDTIIIEPQNFEKQLLNILERGKNDFEIKIKEIDTTKFLNMYKDNIRLPDIYRLIVSVRCTLLIKQYPIEYLLGSFWNAYDLIKRKLLKLVNVND